MDIARFQTLMRETYGARDRDRGLERTFAWLVEEVGELSRALFREERDEQEIELADVLAWLVSVADQANVDLDAAVRARYADGCPKCSQRPCTCPTPTEPPCGVDPPAGARSAHRSNSACNSDD
ncbi:MAG: nucleotide pyrophosphohydrolase [Actinobacteria bacterium]|nr:nucleotide pyrophosphohydrolase [Actinomycetota bacterium]